MTTRRARCALTVLGALAVRWIRAPAAGAGCTEPADANTVKRSLSQRAVVQRQAAALRADGDLSLDDAAGVRRHARRTTPSRSATARTRPAGGVDRSALRRSAHAARSRSGGRLRLRRHEARGLHHGGDRGRRRGARAPAARQDPDALRRHRRRRTRAASCCPRSARSARPRRRRRQRRRRDARCATACSRCCGTWVDRVGPEPAAAAAEHPLHPHRRPALGHDRRHALARRRRRHAAHARRAGRRRASSSRNAFMTTPLCCPSRSSILTRQLRAPHRRLQERRQQRRRRRLRRHARPSPPGCRAPATARA